MVSPAAVPSSGVTKRKDPSADSAISTIADTSHLDDFRVCLAKASDMVKCLEEYGANPGDFKSCAQGTFQCIRGAQGMLHNTLFHFKSDIYDSVESSLRQFQMSALVRLNECLIDYFPGLTKMLGTLMKSKARTITFGT